MRNQPTTKFIIQWTYMYIKSFQIYLHLSYVMYYYCIHTYITTELWLSAHEFFILYYKSELWMYFFEKYFVAEKKYIVYVHMCKDKTQCVCENVYTKIGFNKIGITSYANISILWKCLLLILFIDFFPSEKMLLLYKPLFTLNVCITTYTYILVL